DFMHYSISQYSQFIPIRNLLEDACRGIKFTVSRSGKVIKLLKQIPSAKGAEQIILLLSLLQIMATNDNRKYLTTSHYIPSPSIMRNERMEKVIAYLNKHYTESVGLDEIASYTAMNPTAFCRYFKENTGKTFKEYVLDMRIGYACKLLNSSVMNISQISATCGFESPVHFNRIFKRVTGMTPTIYREQME
ncbi:AraC family transcriptional regulator, partial [Bacteroides acidifaciens]